MLAILAALLLSAANGAAQRSPCTGSAGRPVIDFPLGGRPIDVVTDSAGCNVYVTVAKDSGSHSGLLWLQRTPAGFTHRRYIALDGAPFGMHLSRDENRLYVAAGDRVLILDVPIIHFGGANPIVGDIRDSSFVGAVMVTATPDDSLLFVSLERAAAVGVVDLRGLRSTATRVTGIAYGRSARNPDGSVSIADYGLLRPVGLAGANIVGSIPTGRAPISVVLSPDARYLYATSQEAPPSLGYAIECRPQANRSAAPDHAAGVVYVIDVRQAQTDPARSIVGTTKAGCNPVRLALSPDGSRAFVTARTDDRLLVFETDALQRGNATRTASVSVGTAPVGVAVTTDLRRAIVANSNRFAGAPDESQDLSVIDMTVTPPREVGRIPAGSFPRQLHVARDGRTLYVTNFESRSLMAMDLGRWDPASAFIPARRAQGMWHVEYRERRMHEKQSPRFTDVSRFPRVVTVDSIIFSPGTKTVFTRTVDTTGSVAVGSTGDANLGPLAPLTWRDGRLHATVAWDVAPSLPPSLRRGLRWNERIQPADEVVGGQRFSWVIADSAIDGRRRWIVRDSVELTVRRSSRFGDARHPLIPDSTVYELAGTVTGAYAIDESSPLISWRADTIQLTGVASRWKSGSALTANARFEGTRRWTPTDEHALAEEADNRSLVLSGIQGAWPLNEPGVVRLRSRVAAGDTLLRDSIRTALVYSTDWESRRRLETAMAAVPVAQRIERPLQRDRIAAGDTTLLLSNFTGSSQLSDLDSAQVAYFVRVADDTALFWRHGILGGANYDALQARLANWPIYASDSSRWPCRNNADIFAPSAACQALASAWPDSPNLGLRYVGLVVQALMDPRRWGDSLVARQDDGSLPFTESRFVKLLRASSPAGSGNAPAPPAPGADWTEWRDWMVTIGRYLAPVFGGRVRLPPDPLRGGWEGVLHLVSLRSGRDVAAEVWSQYLREASDSGRLVLSAIVQGLYSIPLTPEQSADWVVRGDSLNRHLALTKIYSALYAARPGHGDPVDSQLAADLYDVLGRSLFEEAPPWKIMSAQGVVSANPWKPRLRVAPPQDKPVYVEGLPTPFAGRWADRAIVLPPGVTAPTGTEATVIRFDPVVRMGPFVRIRYRDPLGGAQAILLEVDGEWIMVRPFDSLPFGQ